MTKNQEENSKNYFGSELSVAKNDPTFKIHHRQLKKNREKRNRKIIFGSEFSETNNEPTKK